MEGDFLGVPILYCGSGFTLGAASAGGNQFRRSRLFFLITTCAKHTGWALMRRRLVLGKKGTQNWAAQCPRKKGPLTQGRECANPSRSRRSLLLVSGPFLPLGGLCCYLFLFSVHPPLALVSHPYLSSSACPLSHSFWRSVSCCGPHHPIQGSHPHQRGG